jgi:regulator of protease activity HflC (stomatin/prohibitin superfamily)
MKKGLIIAGVLTAILLIFSTSFVSCTRIEAGYVGIKVNLLGSNRGVQDITEVTGFVFYNPWTTKIYEFPVFVQHKVWTADATEDSPRNEEFTVTTKDGLSVSFDVGLDYQVVQSKVPEIFNKYRKPLNVITEEFIRTMVRNAYNQTASGFDAEELVAKRADFENNVKKRLDAEMKTAGFDVVQVGIIGKIRLPKGIENAINAKIQAVQEAIRAENQKQSVIAEANKTIEEAKGYAEARRIRAEGDAKANEILSKSLTPMLVQKMYIEKWDGKLPVYGQVPQLFKDVK